MYQYQETGRYFAQVAGGLEDEGAKELAELGATNVETAYRGVYFDADAPTLYGINYRTRLATRVLAPLVTFDCHSTRYLYRTVQQFDWTTFLGLEQTFAVFANVSNSKIRHSKYAALTVKDAIVDQFRDRTGERPSIDTRDPDLWINLYLQANRAVLSIDTSGGSLHRRGYREASVEAPMQETVAAAVIRLSGWDGATPLYDPMCGSGTLLAEALMHAARIPAGYHRDGFGFARLPDFDADAWRRVKQAADDAVRPVPEGLIAGSDQDADALAAARANLDALPHGDRVPLRRADFRQLDGLPNTTIVVNPPYGLRLGRKADVQALYRDFGDFLKQRCTGSTAYLYAGKRELLKSVGLRPSWKQPLTSGALDGRLAKYEMY